MAFGGAAGLTGSDVPAGAGTHLAGYAAVKAHCVGRASRRFLAQGSRCRGKNLERRRVKHRD